MRLGVYKHDNNTDVAMKVVGSKREEGGFRVIVLWLNIVNPNNVFRCMDKHEVHFIKDEQLPNWKEYNVGTV